MPKIDVIDEAVIDAPPMVVYKALLDEIAGVTHWSSPTVVYKLRGDMPMVREGAIVDLTIRDSGVTTRISGKFTKIVEGKSIEEEYTGDFVGNGIWTFEPTANGKTKVQLRFNARTNRLLFSLLAPFVNIGKKHSDTTQKGFKACNSYLCKK